MSKAKQRMELYYLSTCDTCRRIMKELRTDNYPFRVQDIKTQKITPQQIDNMAQLAGGYAPLFSRVAIKYRALGLHTKQLNEQDYRKYILEEYTFLKRPVFILDNAIFIGNAPSNIQAVRNALQAV